MAKILVVDDEPLLVEVLCEELSRAGYEVISATSGNGARRILESESVDLVLTDSRMKDGDGLGLLDWIRERHPTRPYVLLSSAFADIDPAEAQRRGAQAMFGKPYDFELICETLAKLLSGSSHA